MYGCDLESLRAEERDGEFMSSPGQSTWAPGYCVLLPFLLAHKLIKMFLQACSNFPVQLLTLHLGISVNSAVAGRAQWGWVVRAQLEPGKKSRLLQSLAGAGSPQHCLCRHAGLSPFPTGIRVKAFKNKEEDSVECQCCVPLNTIWENILGRFKAD